MRFNILIAGKAGQGIKQTANVLSRALVNEGLYVFNYRYYQSLVSGGHNFNVLCVSDKPARSFDRDYDAAILLDKNSLHIHEEEFSEDCLVLYNFEGEYNDGIKIDTSEWEKVENMYFAGALFKILGIGKKGLLREVRKTWEESPLLDKDVMAIEEAYKRDYNKSFKDFEIGKGDKKGKYMNGTEATGIGSIESGLDVYFAYPMTPATPLLGFLAKKEESYGYITYQPENEIAVANAALGSSFSGAKTMIGSSGGGVDLMGEALSMQGMTELPLVCYLAMRGGPSSGAATYTSQQDLRMALGIGHGDFPRVVIAPGDIEESYKKAKEAFYLSEKYGLLNILLTDKHLGESGYTQEMENYDLFEKKDREVPGKEFVKRNSYTHDEKGNYTEDPEIIEKGANKRKEKFERAKKEIENKFDTHKIYGRKNGKKLIIGFGSTKGPILDSLYNLKGYKYIHIIYMEPFSSKLKREIEKAEEIFVVENNPSGQLADLVEKNTQKSIDEEHRILKYNARPFTPNEIIERLDKND